MDYDEPDEPTEEEMDEHDMEQAAAKNTQVQITGLSAADIAALIRGILRENIDREVRHFEVGRRVREAVDAKLGPLAQEAIKDLLAPVVAQFIEEGFPVFDSYSGKETKRITVRSVVEQALTTPIRSDYDREKNGKTPLEVAVNDAIKKALDGEFKPLLAEAASKLKASVDNVIEAKLKETFKQALGLR